MTSTLLLVDGSSYLYRAYHAMAPLTAPDGTPTGAMYGVLNMLRRLRADYPHQYAAVVFDAKGKNFRHELFPDYKATRPPMPDDLRPQAEILPEIVQQSGWPVLRVAGVEADDVMATLAQQGVAQGWQVIIATGDKDMAQLVNGQITLINTMKDETLDVQGVMTKFGVWPQQIRDYLALMGDKVDNVPGVEKCGPKTAAKWLQEYGSLAGVMEHARQIKGKAGENLQAALPQLPLSYELVSLKTDVDLRTDLPEGIAGLQCRTPDWHALAEVFARLNFRTWLKEAQSHLQPSTPNQHQLFDADRLPKAPITAENQTVGLPEAVPLHYQTITQTEQLAALLARLANSAYIGLDTETTSLNPMQARLVGISIAFAAGEAAYIPLAHHPAAAPEQLPLGTTLEQLRPHLENPKLGKIGQHLKYDCHVLANHGITLRGIIGDAMLASYVLESHQSHNLDDLAQRHLGLTTITYEELCGKGAKAIAFADVAVEQAAQYACQDADFALRIEGYLKAKMSDTQRQLYENLEIPVSAVLWEMERNGIAIDSRELARQSHELGSRMLEIEQQAYTLANRPFNLNSPKQLQEILFGQMGIPSKGLAKTASGGVSTNEAVLEQLAADYPLPKIILEHRSLAKLKSTYTDKLPEMADARTGRIHTHYAQAVAITGRLASNNPNLQNIPIRTEAGRRVRRAFVAPSGSLLVSADYSQIELRIMAHLSGDAALCEAFRTGQDIHRRTAADIFGTPVEAVSAEQRRYAKTINFGLIYGMGQYGLAKALGIDNLSAKTFIDRYFARYPAVADYMQRTKEKAASMGYVETLFGRRLYLPDIRAKNANVRAGAERAAINAPMQGTASDLIKRAMLAVSQWLHEGAYASQLLLQVHDELVLQVPESEWETVRQALPELMAAADGGLLNVPLLAEVGSGSNWEAAH